MLTRRAQIQAIANALAGWDSLPPENEFSEPWRTAFQIVVKTDESPIHALRVALDDQPDILDLILQTRPGEGPSFQSLYELGKTLVPIKWLWPNWIPYGMLSLLGGMPGAGKSYLALDLARRLIGDQWFPDGSPVKENGEVIYLDAENVPQILNQRAKAWNMDTSRLFPMLPADGMSIIDLGSNQNRDDLYEMCQEINPLLIIVDSLSSITTKSENNIEDIRTILAFLNSIAGEFGAAVLLVHHLRKRNPLSVTDSISIHDFRGSSHIVAMSRSVIALSIIQDSPEMDRNGPRRLEVLKTNLTHYPPALGIKFKPLKPSGIRLDYGEAPKAYEQVSKMEQCGEWLIQMLEEARDPIQVKDIVARSEEKGFSRSTLFRARKYLGSLIEDTEGTRSPTNQWTLTSFTS